MKQAMNFRLNQQAVNELYLLEKKLHASKTAVVEQALHLFAKKELSQKPILKYAGILTEKAANAMLKNIKSSRRNKEEDSKL